MWKESKSELCFRSSYYNRGPYEYKYDSDVLYKQSGDYDSIEFHWTIGDYLNAAIKGGCRIDEVFEYGEDCEKWEGAPMKGLPEIFAFRGTKES